ncbi:MAG: hypothetical protein HUJ92_04955, partial [Bacteroidales bacterium]|nr:hypothetical protein [Bacteroidales bacterium]
FDIYHLNRFAISGIDIELLVIEADNVFGQDIGKHFARHTGGRQAIQTHQYGT